MRPDIILCLGNEILSDDSFGFRIAQILQQQYDFNGNADVVFAPLGGFNLIDLMKDRERALIVDTIVTGKVAPGTIHFHKMGQFTRAKNLTCSHQISLPSAIAFAKEYGITMPGQIDVLAVEAKDVETLNESLTPRVKAAIGPAIDKIIAWLGFQIDQGRPDEQRKQEGSFS